MSENASRWVAEVRAAVVQVWALVLVGGGMLLHEIPWAWGLGAVVLIAAPTTSVRDVARLASRVAGVLPPKGPE